MNNSEQLLSKLSRAPVQLRLGEGKLSFPTVLGEVEGKPAVYIGLQQLDQPRQVGEKVPSGTPGTVHVAILCSNVEGLKVFRGAIDTAIVALEAGPNAGPP